MRKGSHRYNGPYTGRHLDRIAFPMGGLGAGMMCLEGTGALSHVSLRHRPEVFHEPLMFSALWIEGAPTARLLEGPVPSWKLFGPPGAGNGSGNTSYGLPRFREASFKARFPAATVSLRDPDMPVHVAVTGWSPFTPGCSDDSCLPTAALDITLTNTQSDRAVKGVYSLHARNFMAVGGDSGATVKAIDKGFELRQPASAEEPWREGTFRAEIPGEDARVDCAWFRGGWFDPLTMLWKAVQEGGAQARPEHADGNPGAGASIYLPLKLKGGEKKTIRVLFSWYVPRSNMRLGTDACACTCDTPLPTYEPWYAGRFGSVVDVAAYWRGNVARLHQESETFARTFYDTTLPAAVIEAIAANLTILKSPTCLRQKDGRFWGWEGCCDHNGCCEGSCTHVWNYAQALAHLFPDLERSMRDTEFNENQDERGHQTFRAALPVRPVAHGFHAAADGQLGGIMKAFREWRISADTEWLRARWPAIRKSLDYCIETWDPKHEGTLSEPHHNTYDIEFWGPDGMCTSFYLGALRAAILMGEALDEPVETYCALLEAGKEFMDRELFNGEYYIQKIQWQNLRANDPTTVQTYHGNYAPEALELLQREGPKYQYGNGCLSDGVLGFWLAAVCGVDDALLDADKIRSHVAAVHRYNLRQNLASHSNPQRPTFAAGDDGGLLLCSWPQGSELSLPFVYSDEVWTGIEYQVAAHLMLMGCVDEAMDIVRTCRDRYDGTVRNPFNEYECGHWYARAMSSYGMLQCLTGCRYDAVTRTLHVAPRIPGDFRAFICTATGYGTAGVKDGKPFLRVAAGSIEVGHIEYTPADN